LKVATLVAKRSVLASLALAMLVTIQVVPLEI
jgi:hypothetical protein